MRTLSASDSTLVIQTPAWIGIALVAVAIGLTAFAFARRPQRAIRLGLYLGTLVALYVAWHALATRLTFEPRGFVVDGIYGEEERVGWLGVASVDTKSEPGRIVFHLRSSREVPVDVSDLDADGQARIAAFARARLTP